MEVLGGERLKFTACLSEVTDDVNSVVFNNGRSSSASRPRSSNPKVLWDAMTGAILAGRAC